ncbi:unnamed protein product [Clonostachys rosea]|uniref:Cytochrome P450 n=1 Tax=Bionectria ochroleuca TaxID=29856 RepID=A0ABY6UCZ4_BIOOC|nr:unnamed protein product [Clonostachys rosea]
MYPEPNINDSYGKLALLVPLLWILYFIGLTIYRVTLHPLAKFPGPTLAGATYLYEAWFDVVLWGRYTHQIGHLHQEYGPIIRINPDELHCNDHLFANSIYTTGSRRRDKSSHYVHSFPPRYVDYGLTIQATVSHDLHRIRRRAMNKFFSRAQICELESTIQSSALKLCRKILSCEGQGALNLASAYSCFTADLISDYSFGQSFGFLDQPGWEPNYKRSVDILLGLGHVLRLLPILGSLMEMVPLSLMQLLSRDIGKVVFPHQIELARESSKPGAKLGAARSTIFTSLLEDSTLPREEKTTARLASEANSIMVGGTESTAVTLSLFTYHVLANPDVLDRIRAEIDTVTADDQGRLPGHKLEQLPYFTAAIQEALRLVHGISGRAARIAPDEDLVYIKSSHSPVRSCYHRNEFVIPRGYAVGMSAYLLHTDKDIFPEPHQFRPQRWLDKNGKRDRSLDKYLFTFGKGDRQCVGMQLAYWELYICAAALIVRVFPRLSLSGTSVRDVQYDHDELIGKPYVGSKGVRVLVSNKEN